MAASKISEAALGVSGASLAISSTKAIYDVRKDVVAHYKKQTEQNLDDMTRFAHISQDVQRVANPNRPQPIASETTTSDANTTYSTTAFAGWENYRALAKAEVSYYYGDGNNTRAQYAEDWKKPLDSGDPQNGSGESSCVQWQDYDASAPNHNYPKIGSKGQPLDFAVSTDYHDQWVEWQYKNHHSNAKIPKTADTRPRHKPRRTKPNPAQTSGFEIEDGEDITSMAGAVRSGRYLAGQQEGM